MTEREEFENWYSMYESDNDKKPKMFEAWQAGREPLQARIAELERQKATLFKEGAEAAVIAGARIAQLEEALMSVGRRSHHSDVRFAMCVEALSESSSDWLKRHDNEVLERAAVIANGCDSGWAIAAEIRKLKEV